MRAPSEASLAGTLALKEKVFAVLRREGIDSFVEGAVDALDLDFEYGMPQADQFEQHGGHNTPISVYKYNLELLEGLRTQIAAALGDQVHLEILSSPTQEWMDGWKDSFKPIATECFYVYPPWESPSPAQQLLPIVIEPGMAFGTGQHATTQLCLEIYEQIVAAGMLPKVPRVLDVGTGTGILAIAAAKLSGAKVVGTDIDIDAITAAKANAAANSVQVELISTSLPEDPASVTRPYELIFANILFVVLERLVIDLAKFLRPGGHLVLSGLLEEDADKMLAVCKNAGLDFAKQVARHGWLCMHVRRPE